MTTPLRTLVDLADVLNPKQLTRALNEAQVQRLITANELTTLPTRYPGRRTAHLTPEQGATRSHLEDRFVRFLKRHHLPLPELNQRIAGHEVDAVYRQQRLIIELDSRQFHTTPTAFEADRDRDADLLNAGFSTLRITDQRLKDHASQRSTAAPQHPAKPELAPRHKRPGRAPFIEQLDQPRRIAAVDHPGLDAGRPAARRAGARRLPRAAARRARRS